MAVLVQVNFAMQGPWGAEMSEAFRGLAESINAEPGFIWKVWIEDEAVDIAIALSDSRVRQDDISDSFKPEGYAGRYRAALEDAALHAVDLVEQFPVLTFMYGYTRGGADPAKGTGLRGLADRVDVLGGRLEVESPAGAGTRVTAVVPLEQAA